MTWGDGGLQHSDGSGNLVFASHLNTKAMQERGNKIINGCIVTEQSPTPDLTVEVASGNVIANGIVVAVSASDPFAGTPVTFATTQGALATDKSIFVMVHVDSSGVITNTEGTAADSGQQLPPEIPEDECLLAMIVLTFGDSTISTVDIEDWRQFTPDGIALADNKKITLGDPSANATMHFDGTNLIFNVGASGDFSLEQAMMIDLGNKAEITCIYEVSTTDTIVMDSAGHYTNSTTDDIRAVFAVPLPTLKGNLKLYVKDVIIGIKAADGTNYVDTVRILAYDATTETTILNDNSGWASSGKKTISNASADDVSSYDRVVIYLILFVDTATNLDINYVKLECYYSET